MKKCGVKDNLSRVPGISGRAGGFSLIELLIAMAVGLVVLAAMYSVFTIQNKTFANQEELVVMQQNARAAMDMMSREIRMAGYNPKGTLTPCSGTTSTTNTCVGIKEANATSISFTADLNGNEGLTAGSANPNENIIYDRYLSSGIYALGRTSNGAKQPVVENVDTLSFSYFDANGNSTNNLANIREIQISIRVRTAKTDPDYTDPTFDDKYRRYTLTSQVTPRNLAY